MPSMGQHAPDARMEHGRVERAEALRDLAGKALRTGERSSTLKDGDAFRQYDWRSLKGPRVLTGDEHREAQIVKRARRGQAGPDWAARNERDRAVATHIRCLHRGPD